MDMPDAMRVKWDDDTVLTPELLMEQSVGLMRLHYEKYGYPDNRRRMMDGYRIVVFPDLSGEHRWRLETTDNVIQATSGGSFPHRDDAARAARLTATIFCNLVIVAFGLNLGNEVHHVDVVPVEFEGYDKNGEISEPVASPTDSGQRSAV